MRWVAIAALVVGCSDDPFATGNECFPGNDREVGPGCALPVLDFSIDGSDDEWSAELYEFQGNSCCDAESPSTFQLARSAGALVAHLRTQMAETSVNAIVLLLRDSPDGRYTHIVLKGGVSPRIFVGGTELFGIPIDTARTATGVEISVPLDALPYGTGAIVTTLLFDADNEWIDQRVHDLYFACWDPEGHGCEL